MKQIECKYCGQQKENMEQHLKIVHGIYEHNAESYQEFLAESLLCH